MPTFVVAPGRAMLVKGPKGRKILKERTVVDLSQLGEAEAKRLLREGFIVRVNAEVDQNEQIVQVKADGSLVEAPPQPPKIAVGLWNVDPKKVVGKSLEQLNVMIAEKDPATPPAATVEAAIKQLSLDFQG